MKHFRDKVEDQFWAVDGLAELYSVHEFTIRIPEDDLMKSPVVSQMLPQTLILWIIRFLLL